MKKEKTLQTSLGLSIMPSIFAAGCCATTPLMIMFGFSLGEQVLSNYIWHFRFLGFLVLLFSVSLYFYKQGIRSKRDIVGQKNIIILITVQTLLYSTLIYVFLIKVATPAIYQQVLQQVPQCCGL